MIAQFFLYICYIFLLIIIIIITLLQHLKTILIKNKINYAFDVFYTHKWNIKMELQFFYPLFLLISDCALKIEKSAPIWKHVGERFSFSYKVTMTSLDTNYALLNTNCTNFHFYIKPNAKISAKVTI